MKFIHFSNVQLGLHSESGRRWGDERLLEVADTLKKAAARAYEEKADLVMIAGGLFAHCPITAELSRANSIFSEYPAIRFVITAGENDPVTKSSPVRSFRWAQNVRFVLSGTPEKLFYPEIGTVIAAASCTDGPVDPELFGEVEFSEKDPPARIALFSGPELTAGDCGAFSAFSYVAAGGGSDCCELEKNRICRSGSLEPGGMEDRGGHGYVTGVISPETGAVCGLSFEACASASYIPLLVQVTPDTAPEDLCADLEREINARGAANIYRVRLQGQRLPETVFDLAPLSEKYRIASVSDETEPRYDFEALFNEHRQDMIGYFISAIIENRGDISDLEKKAMYYGIDALISTSGREEEM